jgi:hypothetical protein
MGCLSFQRRHIAFDTITAKAAIYNQVAERTTWLTEQRREANSDTLSYSAEFNLFGVRM